MAQDIKLDLEIHDLAVENYDLALVDKLVAVQQLLTIRLKFFYGEWFLDTTKGVKLYGNILVKNPNLKLVATLLKTAILETPDVRSLLSYSHTYDRATRSLSVVFSCDTTFGAITNLAVGV
jgi:hypothetical protein